MVRIEHSWLSSMSATVVKHTANIGNQKWLTDVLGYEKNLPAIETNLLAIQNLLKMLIILHTTTTFHNKYIPFQER